MFCAWIYPAQSASVASHPKHEHKHIQSVHIPKQTHSHVLSPPPRSESLSKRKLGVELRERMLIKVLSLTIAERFIFFFSLFHMWLKYVELNKKICCE